MVRKQNQDWVSKAEKGKLPVKAVWTRPHAVKEFKKKLIPLNAVMNNAGVFPHTLGTAWVLFNISAVTEI